MNVNFKEIERCLGFQLYPWVKYAFETGDTSRFPDGRMVGKTTYSCLKAILEANKPMLVIRYVEPINMNDISCDMEKEVYVNKEIKTPRIYLSSLQEIYEKLTNNKAVIPMRQIIFK